MDYRVCRLPKPGALLWAKPFPSNNLRAASTWSVLAQWCVRTPIMMEPSIRFQRPAIRFVPGAEASVRKYNIGTALRVAGSGSRAVLDSQEGPGGQGQQGHATTENGSHLGWILEGRSGESFPGDEEGYR